MSASVQLYKNLIAEIYEKKVLTCPLCHGMDPDCICMKKFQKLCDIANAKIPYKFRYARTDKFIVAHDAESKQKVNKYIYNLGIMRKEGMGMWIAGGPQAGKTLLICSILVGAIQSGFSSYYLELNEFYRLQEIRYSDDSSKYQNTLITLNDTDFLAIDGIGMGVQGAKQASKQALAHLLKQRLDAKRPTIIGSVATDLRGLAMISSELPALIIEGCPIEVMLSGDQAYIEAEAKKKQTLFENLPEGQP